MKFFKLLILFLLISPMVYSNPSISFTELMENFERNPKVLMEIKQISKNQNIPYEIYTSDKKLILAKGIENGQLVYAVIRNLLNVFENTSVMYYSQVKENFNLSTSKLVYGNGRVEDNTNGVYDVQLSSSRGAYGLLMIPEWSDKVFAFDGETGDLVDTNFIPITNPQLQSPKQATLHISKRILVSDQISDVVQRFDTLGNYINIFAPSTGLNTAILDNIRGFGIRNNWNILVTVGSGASQNTIQQFDTAGNHIGTFINTNVNSPFSVLVRSNDILVTNSSGTADVTRFDLNGTYLDNFAVSSLSFAQQIIRLSNGNIATAYFTGTTTSGLLITDSTGTSVANTFQSVTGLRGCWQLPNGNFIVTNASGVHEINGTTGASIRTIIVRSNFQYVDKYNPQTLTNITPITTNSVADAYSLKNNYPNPFNPQTTIEFTIPENGFVKLKVYDVLGKEVSSLVNANLVKGNYKIDFDGSGLNSGIYFYRLESGSFVQTKRMTLIK
ncbi:MAG TPA: T9SS type A sorting domain-containing protein [Ignavibacteria bacterium]|nr:T9SS type A sorting domain-containing protein [Ignavibacteria bacterium]